jgi:hypothetical protein
VITTLKWVAILVPRKQTKPWEDGKHQTTGEEKTSNQRVALSDLTDYTC